MSTALELAARKQALLTRSALCRLRLRRDAHLVRASLDWKRGVVALGSMPALRRVAMGVAFSLAAKALRAALGVVRRRR